MLYCARHAPTVRGNGVEPLHRQKTTRSGSSEKSQGSVEILVSRPVKPFHKGRRTKKDQADGEVVATAARQGNIRFVPVKSVDQQVRLSWHR